MYVYVYVYVYVCVCDYARACMHALEFWYLPAPGRMKLPFGIGFLSNSNGLGPQGMELRNAASTPSRWFPATFIDGSSTFEFPEEERLQLRMKFLYPEYLCCLSAVVDAAAPAVEEAQTTFVADAAAAPPPPSAFDAAEALLTQLVTMQVHQHLRLMMLPRLTFCCSEPGAPDVAVCLYAAVHGPALLLRARSHRHRHSGAVPRTCSRRLWPRIQRSLGRVLAPAPHK